MSGPRRRRKRRLWQEGPQVPEDHPWRDELPDGVFDLEGFSRRDFLKVMGASLALAGAGACTRPPREPIMPYVDPPHEVRPGVPRLYATTSDIDGYGVGLVVQTREGRPIKVEGNPAHPASLGATSPLHQALLLGMYEPQRARAVQYRQTVRSWLAFSEAVSPEALAPLARRAGAGLHIVMEPTSSPLLGDMLERVRGVYPEMRVHYFSALPEDAWWEGTRVAFGAPRLLRPEWEKAEVVLSYDDDFVAEGPGHLADARRFMRRRVLTEKDEESCVLYAVEPTFSLTGSRADHRLAVPPGEVLAVAQAVFARVLEHTHHADVPEPLHEAAKHWRPLPAHESFVHHVSQDLLKHREHGVVLAGPSQPVAVQLLAQATNALVENLGKTLMVSPPPLIGAGAAPAGLNQLAAALWSGEVDTLISLGVNPAYAAPPDVGIGPLLARRCRHIHVSQYEDETAGVADWFIPHAHPFERWGDARAFDGTASFTQPMIEPLFHGKTFEQVLAAFLGEPQLDTYQALRARWLEVLSEPELEEALSRGLILGTAYPLEKPELRWEPVATVLCSLPPPRPTALPAPYVLEASFRYDQRLYDGRFANNAWLLEMPDPISSVAWMNVALLSPVTAARLQLGNSQVVELSTPNGVTRAPVLVFPGIADGAIVLPLGWGRTRGAELSQGRGFASSLVQSSMHPHVGLVTVRPTTEFAAFPMTHEHLSTYDRELVPEASVHKYRHHHEPIPHHLHKPPSESLYQRPPAIGPQWGMAIDTMACIGCHSCVIACQAENNIPVVGPEGVLKGREMHWLRIDRYVTASPESPHLLWQPMLCQHCEMAPCEYVCPVYATVHSPDGLNEMIYNRCIGTRDCATNCPYKVRRFNWFDYFRDEVMSELLKLVYNPEVTVRGRGVMEKCTYCVQRIRKASLDARMEERELVEGDVRTACQQSCPTDAIVFGDITNEDAEVQRLRTDKRSYALLGELGTQPRTRYLATLWHEHEHEHDEAETHIEEH